MLSIRTQDRMALVPYDKRINVYNLMTKNHKNEDIITEEYEITLGGYPLGTYKTKARALEVLDEISKATIGRLIINSPSINNEHWTNEYVTYVSQGSQEQIIPLPTVYQMPKN